MYVRCGRDVRSVGRFALWARRRCAARAPPAPRGAIPLHLDLALLLELLLLLLLLLLLARLLHLELRGRPFDRLDRAQDRAHRRRVRVGAHKVGEAGGALGEELAERRGRRHAVGHRRLDILQKHVERAAERLPLLRRQPRAPRAAVHAAVRVAVARLCIGGRDAAAAAAATRTSVAVHRQRGRAARREALREEQLVPLLRLVQGHARLLAQADIARPREEALEHRQVAQGDGAAQLVFERRALGMLTPREARPRRVGPNAARLRELVQRPPVGSARRDELGRALGEPAGADAMRHAAGRERVVRGSSVGHRHDPAKQRALGA